MLLSAVDMALLCYVCRLRRDSMLWSLYQLQQRRIQGATQRTRDLTSMRLRINGRSRDHFKRSARTTRLRLQPPPHSSSSTDCSLSCRHGVCLLVTLEDMLYSWATICARPWHGNLDAQSAYRMLPRSACTHPSRLGFLTTVLLVVYTVNRLMKNSRHNWLVLSMRLSMHRYCPLCGSVFLADWVVAAT